MSEIRDKGKGLYAEISTLLSEYLVIQVQEIIKSYISVACLDRHEWKCSLSSLITNCIHVVLLIYQKGLIYLVNRPKKLSVS